MYARHECRHFIGTGMEAGLLVELLMSRALLLQSSSDPLNGVRGLDIRIKVLLEKAALYFCCQGSGVLLSTKERFVFPLTVMTPRGPGILSLR